MNIQTPLPKSHQPWEQVRGKLDQNGAVLQHVRHALLPGRGLRPLLQGRIRAPLRVASRQDARAQARRRDRAGRTQPLELRRRHAVAHRPLGVARHRLLRGGAARRRADAGVLDGRHALRGGAARMRQCAHRRAPQPQRQVCRGHGRAAQGAEARTRPHRARSKWTRATTTICRSTSTTCCASRCPTPRSFSPRASCTSWW